MEFRVDFAQVNQVNNEVDNTTNQIFSNNQDIESEEKKIAGFFTGSTADSFLPALAKVRVALHDYKDSVSRLNSEIDTASQRFLAADKRGQGMFA